MPGGPYPWPVKPLAQAHPVRGYFNDPRISGTSRAFHFGIDIAVPDGTPVYAIEAGKVHLEGGRALSVVSADGGRSFGYWHVVPAASHHQVVAAGEILGHTATGWSHLHFAERRAGSYRNPLRPGALTPWVDPTSPRIAGISLYRAGTRQAIPLASVFGPIDVVAEAFDLPPLPVAPPWNDLPVTPARMRWRVLRNGTTVRPWRAPVDFTNGLLSAERFESVFAHGTRQNRAGRPGRYRFFLAHDWSTGTLPDGGYRIQVEASDESGNSARAGLPFTIANEV